MLSSKSEKKLQSRHKLQNLAFLVRGDIKDKNPYATSMSSVISINFSHGNFISNMTNVFFEFQSKNTQIRQFWS